MKYELKGNYFYGEFQSTNDLTADVLVKKVSPADTSNLLWELKAKRTHIEEVIQSATDGYEEWRKVDIKQRIEALYRFQEAVQTRSQEMAEAISLETGKPLWETKGEVNGVINKVKVTVEQSLPRITYQKFENIAPETTGHLYYKPIGPCLIIGPFNFPCHLPNGQILAALLSGNSIIFKPSEKTAYSGQLLIECFHQAGFPKGVVNLIQGDGRIASTIARDKYIRGIFFTGSHDVGIKILEGTYHDVSKLVALEMGGKNTVILNEDANLEAVLPELINACFLSTGQRCVATSKVAIHSSLTDEFVSKFHTIAKKIIVDHPIDYEKEPFMGPLIDENSCKNYLNYMGMAVREGAQEIMRGKIISKSHPGHYVSPSIHLFEKFDPKSHFLKSEIFGPNCSFIPFNDIDEAITIANGSEYGLAAAVFTDNDQVFERCVRDIDVGILNRNRSTAGASANLPFGGVKKSGNYRPAALTTVDACVSPLACLELAKESSTITGMKGIED